MNYRITSTHRSRRRTVTENATLDQVVCALADAARHHEKALTVVIEASWQRTATNHTTEA